jgi:hypothetical protein
MIVYFVVVIEFDNPFKFLIAGRKQNKQFYQAIFEGKLHLMMI